MENKEKKKSEHQRSDDEKEVKDTGRGTGTLSFCICTFILWRFAAAGRFCEICPSWLSGLDSVESESSCFNFVGSE